MVKVKTLLGLTRPGQKKEIAHRPADLIISFIALALLVAMSTQVSSSLKGWEIDTFRTINNLPDYLFPIIWPFMQYGVVVTIPLVAAIAFVLKRKRLAMLLLFGGIGIYFAARIIKNFVPRGRPDALIEHIHSREKFAAGSLGFTSGHTAVAATIATYAHSYLSRWWRVASIATLAIVVFGRIYIGGHLPLDVLGGVALGVAVASLFNFIVGVPAKPPKPEETRQWLTQHRAHHPGDIIRLALAAFVFIATTILALSNSVSSLEEYVFRVVNSLPEFMSPLLQFIMQFGALYFVFIAATIALLLNHRRTAIKIISGGVLVWWLTKIAKLLVDRDRPFYILSNIHQRATNSGLLGFPSGHAAVAALIATCAAPYVSKNWSRLIWTVAWITAITRMYVGAHLPLDIIAGLSLGWFFGSLLNLVVGTPAKKVPLKAIRETLKNGGIPITNLQRAQVDARGSVPLIATTADQRDIFIKLIDTEQRSADVLYRLWRFILFKGLGDEVPFPSAKLQAEHEAYVSFQASKAGVRTPPVIVATGVRTKSAIIATQFIAGQTLNDFSKPMTSPIMEKIWRQVKKLHQANIAHRDLRAANILLDSRGQPWLIDFSFAVAAADKSQLRIDLVELLTSLSLISNPAKAVKSAIKVMGKSKIKEILPLIQPVALTSATKKQLKNRMIILDKIIAEIQIQTNSRSAKQIRFSRINYRWIVFLTVLVATIYYIIPKLGDANNSLQSIKHIHSGWVVAAIAASVATYLMSALTVIGSTTTRLRLKTVLVVQLATTALNRITPKGLGGFALTEQYLEKVGLKRIEATASVSTIYIIGVLVHIIMLLITLLFVPSMSLHIDLFSPTKLWLSTIIIIFTLSSIVFLPRLRYVTQKWIIQVKSSIRANLSRPTKLYQLVGGAIGVTTCYALALYCTLEGFGSAVPFGTVLFVYLAGSSIASASPTPGGLGAVEAALVIGLTAVDVSLPQALTGVLAFRLVTFWLPIPPAILAFKYVIKQRIV